MSEMKAAPTTTRTSTRPVTVGDKEFHSITDFCTYYGLKYTSAVYYLRKGMPPEEIIERLTAPGQGNVNNGKTGNSMPCSYNGISYPSVVAASEALGIPTTRIYDHIRVHRCSADMAIKALMEDDDVTWNAPFSDNRADRSRPCVVDGVKYATKGEACKAYGTIYITVRSRMERDGLTFEEALIAGGIRRRAIKPIYSKRHELNLAPVNDVSEDSLMGKLSAILEKGGYEHSCLFDPKRGTGALTFREKLHTNREEREICILFEHPNASPLSEVEITIPELYSVKAGEEQNALIALNEKHKTLAGTQAFLEDGWVRVSRADIVRYPSVNPKWVLRVLHRFVGNAAELLDFLSESEI